ncbi:unnamed protein product [Discosporangium mesarthrocarpum]
MVVRGDTDEVRGFVRDLPVRKVNGVGKVTEKCLREVLGVSTCGQLLEQRAHVLGVFTPCTARRLLEAALGVGRSTHSAKEGQAIAGMLTRKQIRFIRSFHPSFSCFFSCPVFFLFFQ